MTDITLFGKDAGRCASLAYDGFKAMEKVLIATGYSGVKSVWVPRNCPTGISGKTCQADGTNCSLHNYGIAVDIDPYGHGNPHFMKPFGSGWDFSDCKITKAQVDAVEDIENTHGEQYFRWLGWAIGDTMHFELQVPPARTGVNWSTVTGGKDDMLFLNQRAGLEGVDLQHFLNRAGFTDAEGKKLELDGVLGPKTFNAYNQALDYIGRARNGEFISAWNIAHIAMRKGIDVGGAGGLTKGEADSLYQAIGTIPAHGHAYAPKTHSHKGTVTETKEVTLT